MSFTPYSSNAILDGAAIDHSGLWVQVHTDLPGLNGTANVSVASPTRVSAAFTVAANVATSSAVVDLASDGTGTETITHVTLWDALSAGNCLYIGTLVPGVLFTAGDEVRFQAGDLTVTLLVS